MLTKCGCWSTYFVVLAVFLTPSLAELRVCATVDQTASCNQLKASTSDFSCVIVEDKIDCLIKMLLNQTDFGSFSAEEALLVAEEATLLPDKPILLKVAAEVRNAKAATQPFDFRTVAVVRSTHTNGFEGLRGKNYCRENTNGYWSNIVTKAFENKVVLRNQPKVNGRTLAESEVIALNSFFNSSCLPGEWSADSKSNRQFQKDYYRLCQLCPGGTCRVEEDYSALNCLTKNEGYVAYTSFEKVQLYIQNQGNSADYSYLCMDGTLQPLTTSDPCTWVKQPWRAVLTTEGKIETVISSLDNFKSRSAVTPKSILSHILGLSESAVVDHRVDTVRSTVSTYVSRGRESVPQSANEIKVCVESEAAQNKCKLLSNAARLQGVQPTLSCNFPVSNATDCLRQVNRSDADIAIISTEFGYIARSSYKLKPVMYEEGNNYLGVLLINATNITSYNNLKGQSACFPQFSGLGFLTFMNSAIDSGRLSRYTCPTWQAPINFFGNSCAPGINDWAINKQNLTRHPLCNTCLGQKCAASLDSPFYGENGAIKCLSEGSGQFAFVDLKVAKNRTNAHKRLSVLCQDGSVKSINEVGYNDRTCPFLQVVGKEIVRRGNLDPIRSLDIQFALQEINALFNSLKTGKTMSLFGSYNSKRDVLFSTDGTQIVSAADPMGEYSKKYEQLHNLFGHCSSAQTITFSSILSLIIAAMYFIF